MLTMAVPGRAAGVVLASLAPQAVAATGWTTAGALSMEAELAALRARRETLSGAANKKARQKLNQKIRKLEEQQRAQAQAQRHAAAPPAAGPNYLPESEPGCHVARFEADWLVGVEPFDEADFGLPPGAELPDISVDPEERLLSVINPSRSHARSVTLSLPHTLRDADGAALAAGSYRDDSGAIAPCTTLVLLLRPRSMMDVCFVDVEHAEQVCIDSDVKEIALPLPSVATPSAAAPSLPLYGFPLPRSGGPYLCSQGAGGHFTHGFAETLHALDLQCAVGTPVLAIADGTVRSLEQGRRGGGIHVTALYRWNSLMLELEDGRFAEYVHIRGESARVAVGERVVEGQQLCESGDVGFCPTPHLHLQLHASADDAAPTTPFAFRGGEAEGAAVVPVAGRYYGGEGELELDQCLPCSGGGEGEGEGERGTRDGGVGLGDGDGGVT
jgi:murein DD-endopeptidase MepM/ murein hydrolase activator NlpD